MDLAANEAEIIEFAVRRLWDVNECGPPCCPRQLLVETAAGELIHLESWTVLPPADEIGSDCTAHRTIASKNLLRFDSTGRVHHVEQQSVRDLLIDDLAAPECEWVDPADLPDDFRRAIGRFPVITDEERG